MLYCTLKCTLSVVCPSPLTHTLILPFTHTHTEMGRGQSTPPPSITPSAGFNDVLSSLHTLSRELDGQEVGVANSNIRHRTEH